MAMLLLPLLVLIAGRRASAACYFPGELQGDFVMQSTATAGGSQVQYSALNISADSIPIWGHCHRRIGPNVLLMDDSGGAICIRCFHLSLRSPNVLSVLTEGLDKCYTSEDAAVCSCPEARTSAGGRPPQCPPTPPTKFHEILLFKTSGIGGEVVQSAYCPLDGRFAFTYATSESPSASGRHVCSGSEMENCPVGSGLHFRFRGCSLSDHNVTFQCLGHWPGPNNQRYLALSETSSTKKTRARYRCALYHEDADTGIISMAFSSDSTCTSDLRSATDGFETMKLSPQAPIHWTQPLDPSPCLFPSWAEGQWEHMAVESNTLVFRDHRTFTTYTFRCLASEDATGQRSLIFGRTQCGEEIYSCIWMKLRGINVLEFQLGLRSSSRMNESLCMDSNFRDDAWITQGRVDVLRESPCPIAGEYTGFIPDDSGLCAKLYSDCNRPEIMFYRVSACTPEPEVYEEREYRCLGQWEEDGVMYTYTQRRDIGSYECFVGSIVTNSEIYIKEAGEHCQRNVNPLLDGMKLTKRGSCQNTQENSGPSTFSPAHPNPTSPWHFSKKTPLPTKPWKPITGSPKGQEGIQNGVYRNIVNVFTMLSFVALTSIL
ncbi:uncharacterized protein LOC124171057 [Ischnura elegans]|uniref:uncharacterized protein LOC124171057 n=1 Tax=Ischnura elegans TaxID=197161 RepID=UPI001ED88461|nr:uncharacterized protein LOC124171057 [Ischnura elegans]